MARRPRARTGQPGLQEGAKTCPNAPEPLALPSDGKISVTATFTQPATYVLRALVRDRALKTTRDVTVTVAK